MKSVPLSRYLIFFLIAAGGLAWDLYSKWAVFDWLGGPYRENDYLADLWGKNVFLFTTTFNRGALWGVGQGHSGAFAVLSVCAALGVLYWLFIRGEARSWWLTVSLALIMAGTLGNLYDRLGFHGELERGEVVYGVRDFLYIKLIDWPIFNFADMFLVTGAIMLLVQSFLYERKCSLVPPTSVPPSDAAFAGVTATGSAPLETAPRGIE